MSTTIIGSLASILAVLLPLLGVEVGSEALTTTLSTIVVVIAGLWTWRERVKRGDVNWLGARR